MKNNDYVKRLRTSLPYWLGWGVACGSLSGVCAVVFDIAAGVEAWMAMAAGIVTWSMICAGVAASEWYRAAVEGREWVRALRLALRIRAGVTIVGTVVMAVGLGVPWVAGVNLVILPDFWAGLLSVQAGHGVAALLMGAEGSGGIAIYVTTLVQGTWVLGSIGGLAVVIHGIRKLAGRAMSPVEA